MISPSLDAWLKMWSSRIFFFNKLFFCVFSDSLVLFEQSIQHGHFPDCCSDPWEVHRLLPSLRAWVRSLVLRRSPGRPHPSLCQCWHEPGKAVTPPLNLELVVNRFQICPVILARLNTKFGMCEQALCQENYTNVCKMYENSDSWSFSFRSSNLSFWTQLTHPTPWPDWSVLPTPRSASVLEVNIMTWMTWGKMCTTTPSLRCWAPGHLETTLK